MRKIIYILLLINSIAFGIQELNAQRAEAGPDGVWVMMDLSSGTKNNYTILRKSAKRDYERVGKLLPPKSEAEMEARFFDLEALNLNMPARLNEKQQKRLWRVIQKNAHLDSFAPYVNNYPALYAAGLAWYDAEANKGDYSYKVVRSDNNGRELDTKETNAVKVPGSGPNVSFILKEMKNADNVNTLEYEVPNIFTMINVRVFRSFYQRTGYEMINPDVFFTKIKEGYRMTITDYTAASRVPYAYYVVPMDAAGNLGTKSIDVKMYSVPQNTIPPSVTKFKTSSDNEKKAIRLRWSLSDASQVVSIDIYKGIVYDGKYFKVASMKPHDTVYYDYQVNPVATYYYTIVLNGMYETSPTSPRISGMLEGVNGNFLPPQQVQAQMTEKGPVISWTRAETDTRGYFLWRGVGDVSDLKKIKQILSDSVNNLYIDTLPDIKEDSRIYYALTDINTSYNEGPMSDIATCVARTEASLPPPDTIFVYHQSEGNVRIIWKPMGLKFGRVHGYNIYRYYTDENGKEAEGSLIKLNSTMLNYELNQFVDSTMTVGKRWVYFVRCVGEAEDELSKKSPEVIYVYEGSSFLNVSNVLVFPQEGSVKLLWNNPVGDALTDVEVWRSESGKEPKLIKKLGAKTEEYTDSGLKSGNTYFYYFRCSYNGKSSGFTDAIGATVR